MLRTLFICFCSLLFTLCHAGGGPEAVLLVVNNDSTESKHVANVYSKLRQIPPRNIIYLKNIPKDESISLADFKTHILGPILAQVQQRKLGRHIDYVTYSCGFPTRVRFSQDHVKKLRWVVNPQASITGMTYLYQLLQNEEQGMFLLPNSNFYYRNTSINGKTQNNESKIPAEEMKIVNDFFVEKHKRDNKRKKDKAKKTEDDIAWEQAGWKTVLDELSKLAKQYPKQQSVHYNLACAQAMNAQNDAALKSLQSAVDNGYTDWMHMNKDKDLVSLRQSDSFKNIISQLQQIPIDVQKSMGFSAQFAFNKNGGIQANGQGVRYVISTMLAYTGERGNTLSEIESYLQSAHAADYSAPKGCIYFPVNNDVRSTTREWAMRSCINKLKDIGVRAELFKGTIPKQKSDVMGAHVGIAGFDFPNSGSSILPGAICEHLTSWGAEFDRKGQTKISSWLRAGAAGSSGTVSEPLALRFKFPTAFIHLHYANGCSLGEAFYQSVQSPYELLILGDALCQPWAKKASLSIKDLKDQITERCEFSYSCDTNTANAIAFIDGQAFASAKAGESIALDPSTLAPGYHSIRIVAVQNNAALTRCSHEQEIHVGADMHITSCNLEQKEQEIHCSFERNAIETHKSFALFHNGRLLGTSNESKGSISFDSSITGSGPIAIRPVILDADNKPIYWGKIAEIEVK